MDYFQILIMDVNQVGINVASARKKKEPAHPVLRVLASAGRASAGCTFVVKNVFWNFDLSTPKVLARRKHQFATQVWAIFRLPLLPPAIIQGFHSIGPIHACLADRCTVSALYARNARRALSIGPIHTSRLLTAGRKGRGERGQGPERAGARENASVARAERKRGLH